MRICDGRGAGRFRDAPRDARSASLRSASPPTLLRRASAAVARRAIGRRTASASPDAPLPRPRSATRADRPAARRTPDRLPAARARDAAPRRACRADSRFRDSRRWCRALRRGRGAVRRARRSRRRRRSQLGSSPAPAPASVAPRSPAFASGDIRRRSTWLGSGISNVSGSEVAARAEERAERHVAQARRVLRARDDAIEEALRLLHRMIPGVALMESDIRARPPAAAARRPWADR